MYKSHQVIGYIDDVAVIVSDERKLKAITKIFVEEAYKIGLQLNPKKCKVMKIGCVLRV